MWPYTSEENAWYDAPRDADAPDSNAVIPDAWSVSDAEMRRLIARGRRLQARVVHRMARRAGRRGAGLARGAAHAVAHAARRALDGLHGHAHRGA